MFRPDWSDRSNWRDRIGRDARGWLRGLFLKDWTLKALALGITMVLWYGVTGQRSVVTERIPGVHLSVRLAKDMVAVPLPRNDVDLTLTGARPVLDRLSGRDLDVVLNLSDYGPGDYTIQLNSELARVTRLPDGVTYNRIEPNTIKLHLEMTVTRDIPVRLNISKGADEGYEAIRTTRPATVRVRGTTSHVNGLQTIESEPVSLMGRRGQFELPNLRLVQPNDNIDLLDASVAGIFDIRESQSERTFADVTVRPPDGMNAAPEKATVTISGPRSVMEQIHAQDLEIVLLVNADGSAPTPKLNVMRPEWAAETFLREIKPAIFTLK